MTDVTAADLGRVPLFAGLPATELDALAGAAARRRLADGDALFVQGRAGAQPLHRRSPAASCSVRRTAGRR